MGAWGVGAFDNDTSCDWLNNLGRVDNLSLITQTIADILESDEDYLEADAACEAIAACEVIARLKGQWETRDARRENVDRWVLAHPITVSSDLVQSAIQTLDRILTPPSELLELWQENDASEWLASIKNLRERLSF